MTKKYYESPYLKIVGIANDVIATSGEETIDINKDVYTGEEL